MLQVEYVRKRYHKDILCSPVLMLNFCPDLLSEPLELHKATRELLFLIDRSGSMSGNNIRRVKAGCSGRQTNKHLNVEAYVLICCFVVLSGSHGGGPEEPSLWHNAKHCGLWDHHETSVQLQQALH